MLNKLDKTFCSEVLNIKLEIFQDTDGEYWFHASDTPAAKRFQRWVFGDVLKKLRSQGYYIARVDDETLARLQAEFEYNYLF